MIERPRGASTGGDAVRPQPVAAAGRVVTGLLERLSATLRHPAEPPAPARPADAILTVADLVSARGLRPPGARPATMAVDPEPAVDPDPEPDAASDPDPAGATADADAEPADPGEPSRPLPAVGRAPRVQPDPAADPAADAAAEPAADPGPAASGSAVRKPWPWPADPEPAGAALRVVPPAGPTSTGPSEPVLVGAPPAPRRPTDPPDNPSDPPSAELVGPPWTRVFGLRAVPDPDPAAGPDPDPATATDRLTIVRPAQPPAPRAAPPEAPSKTPLKAAPTPAPEPPPKTPLVAAPPSAPERPAAAPRPPVRAPNRFSVAPRPTVVDDLSITGITRRSRGRWGSRAFTLFFVFVFAVILLQLIASLLHPYYR